MCRGRIYVLGQRLWKLWHRSPALFSFAQHDVRTLLQCVPCLSTSQALCDLGGGLCPRGWRKASAGMDLVPPSSGSVYIYYDNMCCPQTLWLSYQCKEQLDVEEQANVLIIHILGLDIKSPLHFGKSSFPLLAYIFLKSKRQRYFILCTNFDHLEWPLETLCWEGSWGHMLSQQDKALWLISEVCHRWGLGVSSTHLSAIP